jgi:hypothetical protein
MGNQPALFTDIPNSAYQPMACIATIADIPSARVANDSQVHVAQTARANQEEPAAQGFLTIPTGENGSAPLQYEARAAPSADFKAATISHESHELLQPIDAEFEIAVPWFMKSLPLAAVAFDAACIGIARPSFWIRPSRASAGTELACFIRQHCHR